MKRYNTIFILILLCVLFVPFAYIYVIFLILKELINNKYETIKYIKDNKYLLLVSIVCLLSIICSKYIHISSFFGMMIFVCILTISYISVNCDGIDRQKLLTLIYIIALITYIIGLFQMIDPTYVMPNKWVDSEEYNVKKRIYSTFFNPNIYGFYINIVIMIICVNLRKPKCKRLVIIERVTFIASILCLFLTFSRTSWISLVLSLISIGVIYDKRYFICAVIIFISIFGSDVAFGINRADLLKLPQDGSLSYRFELWRTSLRVIKDNFVTGIGFGTFFKYTSTYSSLITKYVEHCHNIYLQVLLETGVIGFTTFLVSLVCVVKRLFKEYFLDKTNSFNILVMMVLNMTLIHGLIDSVCLTPQIMIILSCFIGYALAQYRSNEFNLKSQNQDI